jgi:hypothetical protein
LKRTLESQVEDVVRVFGDLSKWPQSVAARDAADKELELTRRVLDGYSRTIKNALVLRIIASVVDDAERRESTKEGMSAAITALVKLIE